MKLRDSGRRRSWRSSPERAGIWPADQDYREDTRLSDRGGTVRSAGESGQEGPDGPRSEGAGQARSRFRQPYASPDESPKALCCAAGRHREHGRPRTFKLPGARLRRIKRGFERAAGVSRPARTACLAQHDGERKEKDCSLFSRHKPSRVPGKWLAFVYCMSLTLSGNKPSAHHRGHGCKGWTASGAVLFGFIQRPRGTKSRALRPWSFACNLTPIHGPSGRS